MSKYTNKFYFLNNWWPKYIHIYVCMYMCMLLLLSRFSRVRLCATPWTAAHQAPPPMGFSRQEHWSGLPLPSPQYMCIPWTKDQCYHRGGQGGPDQSKVRLWQCICFVCQDKCSFNDLPVTTRKLKLQL